MNSKRLIYPVLLFFLTLLIPGASAWCELSDYTFTTATGTPVNMSDATQAMGPGIDNENAGTFPIGFTFTFDGASYTDFSVSSNGWITLGPTTPKRGDQSNAFDEKASYPVITPFWDNLLTTADADGGIYYKTEGLPGERVLTIEFRMEHANRDVSGPYYYQLRLHEGSDKIEFFYISMPSNAKTGGTIGAAVSEKNFASITPGDPATISSKEANNTINLKNITLADNTLYTIRPCEQDQIGIAGDPAQGGTAGMGNGDLLMSRIEVMRGSSVELQPFTVNLGPKACESREFSYRISGPDAGSYNITPASGKLGERESNRPTVTFAPMKTGVNDATLTVTDDNGFERSYPLAAVGVTRLEWIGNAGQGGTEKMADGDVLLENQEVRRGESGTFRPFSIGNISKDGKAGSTEITYQLIDPSGQYGIDVTSADLNGGEISEPTITFEPTGTGYQTAQLVVTTEDDVRTFTLRAYSLAPAATFSVEGGQIHSGSPLFRNVLTCIASPTTYKVTVANINRMDFEITGSEFFATESQIRQGAPRYPIASDGFGNRRRTIDYFLSEGPGVNPYKANEPLDYPIVLEPGETRTFYITYLPTRKGDRYGRLFLRTNGENFTGTEVGSFDHGSEGPVEIEGLLTVDLFGKSIGGTLADGDGTGMPEPLVFPVIEPNTSASQSFRVQNTGDCNLLIDADRLRISAGDVSDFEIVSAFPNTPTDPVTGDYVLAPGGIDSVVVRFTPSRSGSRRATMAVKTNDSALYLPGVAERGTYYVDMYGKGESGLEVASVVTLPPAVIDGPGSTGMVLLTNSSVDPVTVESVVINMGGSVEIVEDPATLWPAFPLILDPAEELELGIAFNPEAGSEPGMRTATMEVLLSNGETVTVTLSGMAGTRLIATPKSVLFGGATVKVGDIKREFAIITNTGTFPLEIRNVQITGTGAADYHVNPLPRAVIAPGQSEFLEVTYIPQAAGTSQADLEITSNATNGTPAGMLMITLGGEASMSTSGGPVDPSGSAGGTIGGEQGTVSRGTTPENNNATSGVNNGTGVALGLSNAPNPVRDETVITFSTGRTGTAVINLYDVQGRLVRTLLDRELPAGNHEIRCDLGALPSGQYFYQLYVDGAVAGRTLTVTK